MMWSVKRAPENGDSKACFSFEQHSVRERLGLIEREKEELSDDSLVSGSPQLVAPICSCAWDGTPWNAAAAWDFHRICSSPGCTMLCDVWSKAIAHCTAQSRELYLFFILRYFSCFHFFLIVFLPPAEFFFQALLEGGALS